MIKRLFSYEPAICSYKVEKSKTLVVSGVNFVDYLVGIGFEIGDKVRQQVAVPGWIKNNRVYSKFCVRGLMDTDGGIFTHRYWVNGKQYEYLKLCFSNMSQPLRKFVYHTLRINTFNPRYAIDRHVWLYSDSESRRYLEDIGSSNERLLRKIR